VTDVSGLDPCDLVTNATADSITRQDGPLI
jgi:hypothetical protein